MILNTLFFNILNIKDDYLTFTNGTAVNNDLISAKLSYLLCGYSHLCFKHRFT